MSTTTADNQPEDQLMMTEMIGAIRAAVAEGATAEQKERGAHACRTILAALGAERGQPITLPGAPRPHPLAGITADQALTLIISRLTAIGRWCRAGEEEGQKSRGPLPPVLPAPALLLPRTSLTNPKPSIVVQAYGSAGWVTSGTACTSRLLGQSSRNSTKGSLRYHRNETHSIK